MDVKSCMKKRVFSVRDTDDIGTAAKIFVKHHIGMLPVVNSAGKLIGILQLRDLLALVMPAFTQFMEDFDFVGDFGAMESIQPSSETVARPVTEVMEEPACVEETCGLSRAFALLHQHELNELPVVDADNRLVGIASRVDIGTALLGIWEIVSGA